MTVSITMKNAAALSLTKNATLRIMTLSITSLSKLKKATLSIMTLSITTLRITIEKSNTQYHDTQQSL